MNRYDTKEWKELVSLQNSARFENVDILTITGFMKTHEELVKHLESCKRKDK